MRSNVAGFALALGMGLMVVLMGLLALSAAGLTSFGPPAEVADEQAVCQGEGPGIDSLRAASVAQVALTPIQLAGESLFKNNCSQCHAVDEKIVGPALAGITKRRSTDWVVQWVHNPAKIIASGDDYAVKLFHDNGQQQMPAFPQLSADEIASILAWVELQEGAGAAAGPALAALRRRGWPAPQ